MPYTVSSIKTELREFDSVGEAFKHALKVDSEYRPAYGVDIEDTHSGDSYRAENGRIAVEVISGITGDDTELGHVMLVGDALMIAWQQGTRTPFDPRNVKPA